MAEIDIVHFDNLVHPDYDLRLAPNNPPVTKARRAMRQAWLHRIRLIAKNPNRALFYFSDYLTGSSSYGFEGLQLAKSYNSEAFDAEMDRLHIAHNCMGPRLICLSGYELPTRSALKKRLSRSGLTYNSGTATLISYGMFDKLCVNAKHSGIMRILMLDPNNCATAPELSIPAPYRL